jgi:hypothetical protein
MWIFVLVLVLLGAQLNLSALVPLQAGDTPPVWWVGGRLMWPFAVETNTLLKGDLLTTLTPILAIVSALSFLLAAGALVHWQVPEAWFPWLVAGGAILSIMLQVIWFSGWTVLPILVDIALLWAVFSQHVTVASLRA